VPHLPWDQRGLFLLCQAGLAAAGYLAALGLPDFRRAFVPEKHATAVAEEQAVQEFHRQGLARTEGETGVLLFVSLFEHRAVVLADRGIDAHVGPEAWGAVDRAILAGLRRGSLREGLVEGIRLAGELLARHVPAPAERDPNELPDRLVVRRD
jgi:putative membrane protein